MVLQAFIMGQEYRLWAVVWVYPQWVYTAMNFTIGMALSRL